MTPPLRFRAYLFDFDGTLVDASEPICQSFLSVLARHNPKPCARVQVIAMIGRPLREMFAAYLNRPDPGEIEQCVSEYREIFMPLALSLCRPMPAMADTVRQLAAVAALGIVTSRPASGARKMLESLGVCGHFGVFVGLDDVCHPKPHPEPVELALRELGVVAGEAAVVGDTPDDMMAAKAAGAFAIGVTTGAFGRGQLDQAGADRTITRLSELLDL